jgi:hypothetical protein
VLKLRGIFVKTPQLAPSLKAAYFAGKQKPPRTIIGAGAPTLVKEDFAR